VGRVLASAAVALSAVIMSACASAGARPSVVRDAPHTLNGVYRTRVDSEFQSGALNGVWRLRLDTGAYTLRHTGKVSKNVIISGVYTTSGRQITFRDRSAACSARPGSGGCRFLRCRRPASYRFTLTDNKLVLARLRDKNTDCELPVVLPEGFHRVR
jgi:hypothetical protein